MCGLKLIRPMPVIEMVLYFCVSKANLLNRLLPHLRPALALVGEGSTGLFASITSALNRLASMTEPRHQPPQRRSQPLVGGLQAGDLGTELFDFC